MFCYGHSLTLRLYWWFVSSFWWGGGIHLYYHSPIFHTVIANIYRIFVLCSLFVEGKCFSILKNMFSCFYCSIEREEVKPNYFTVYVSFFVDTVKNNLFLTHTYSSSDHSFFGYLTDSLWLTELKDLFEYRLYGWMVY